VKYHACTVFRGFLLGVFIWTAAPYVGGLWYGLCGDHQYEQAWLNRAIDHLKRMRKQCDDADLQGILDYTIQRYNRAGAWSVMVAPCIGLDEQKTIGINMPHCPGICIDPEVLTWPAEDGAMVVVHEAMHDYWPYFGHSHINGRERKLWTLSYKVRRCRS
jgi:hypothetical protein